MSNTQKNKVKFLERKKKTQINLQILDSKSPPPPGPPKSSKTPKWGEPPNLASLVRERDSEGGLMGSGRESRESCTRMENKIINKNVGKRD